MVIDFGCVTACRSGPTLHSETNGGFVRCASMASSISLLQGLTVPWHLSALTGGVSDGTRGNRCQKARVKKCHKETDSSSAKGLETKPTPLVFRN